MQNKIIKFSKSLIKKAIAEYLGSLAIVFFGCGAIAIGNLYGNNALLINVPWIFGLTITLMVYAVGHISGAHFNPAVTLAFACVRRFPIKEMPIYWTAQFFGAITGGLMLAWFIPDTTYFGTTMSSIPAFKAVLFEAVLSFFLMFVIIAVATDSRAVGIMAGAAIGITIAVDASIGGTLTGASMNPARSLAPAILEGNFEGLWIYFIGPSVGTCIAAVLYEWIRCDEVNPKHNTERHVKGCC